MTDQPIKVVVADDHAMFRESVAEMLSLDPAIEVVGLADNGAEAVALVEEEKPDVVVLDVEMPVMGAQAAMRRMSRLDPPPRFVIVTVFVVIVPLESLWLLILGVLMWRQSRRLPTA